MLKAMKIYVGDYLFAGKFADPTPALRGACKHIKPNNDASERNFGYVDYRIHKNPNERTETTDARLKMTINDGLTLLDSIGEAKANTGWDGGRTLLRKRKRDQAERREQYKQAKIAKVEETLQKEEKKEEKKQRSEAEFKGVEVARTKAALDDLLRGLSIKMQKVVLRAQIKQLTGAYEVSKHTLPLTKNNKRLESDALYANLVALLSHGDPTLPATEAKLREERQQAQKPKRGRPKKATTGKRQRPQLDENCQK